MPAVQSMFLVDLADQGASVPGHPAVLQGHRGRLVGPVACHHLACTLGVELCFCGP